MNELHLNRPSLTLKTEADAVVDAAVEVPNEGAVWREGPSNAGIPPRAEVSSGSDSARALVTAGVLFHFWYH